MYTRGAGPCGDTPDLVTQVAAMVARSAAAHEELQQQLALQRSTCCELVDTTCTLRLLGLPLLTTTTTTNYYHHLLLPTTTVNY